MISQKSFNRLRHCVFSVEVALVGEAIDLRLGNYYQGQVDPAALACPMCLHPCGGGGRGFNHCDFSIPAWSVTTGRLSSLIKKDLPVLNRIKWVRVLIR
ncbi:MAG: hypothetical protein WBE90_15125 [Xanthobacteraceae bacterium]